MTQHIKTPWPRQLAVLTLVVVTACARDVGSFANKYTTAAERAFPRSYLQLLANAEVDSAYSLLAPSLRKDTSRIIMRQISPLLKVARLDSMRLIGVNITSLGGESRDVNLSYEIPTISGGWLVSNVATSYAGPKVAVIGFSTYTLTDQLEVLNRFTLRGKTSAHFLWLSLAVLIPIGAITVATYVARSAGLPRRWLWVILALITLPTFSINWTTGDIGFNGLSFLLLGGAATSAGPAAPWIVSFALPVGALVAYMKARRWRDRAHTTGSGSESVVAA